MKKSIIFDLDGTLWDSTKQIETVWNTIAKEFGLNIDNNKINEIMGFTKEEIIKFLFPQNIKKGEKFITKCQIEEVTYLSKYGGKIYKNTISTIKELNENYELYIVSNCQSGYIEAFLEYYKLKHLFKDYECSGTTGKSKEENIKLIIERNNITNAVYVGDTEKDYLSAIKNKLDFIWAQYGFEKCNKNIKKINDISELTKCL